MHAEEVIAFFVITAVVLFMFVYGESAASRRVSKELKPNVKVFVYWNAGFWGEDTEYHIETITKHRTAYHPVDVIEGNMRDLIVHLTDMARKQGLNPVRIHVGETIHEVI